MFYYGWTREHSDQAPDVVREEVGISTLERYTGSAKDDIQPYILLTNFKQYVDTFAHLCGRPVVQGTVMRSSHCAQRGVSIIDYGVGSPVAALIAELLSFVKPHAVLMLGMCGGLKSGFQVGDFFNPVAAIREEGTSNAFLPPQCPAMPSFSVQHTVCDEMDRRGILYHNGVIHTTNVRFWEFNESFKRMLNEEQVQAIDMECATLFTVGLARNVPLGALMLISDLPLEQGGIKTKESARKVFEAHSETHLDLGLTAFDTLRRRRQQMD